MGSYGFGGTAAAPIWHDFMEHASAGYCGDFPTPTTYFTGTAFTGPHSSAKEPPPPPAAQTGTNAYKNPKLYAQPGGQKTTPQTTTVQSGGGGVAPPGQGNSPGGGGTHGGGGHGRHG
jgi:hypothetical protein